ncbi:MAG TPA: hypothetical protein VKY26_09935, partial [Actinomycetota bacterium]|nr:hypothetical protein [Actinomycetota bacterium]
MPEEKEESKDSTDKLPKSGAAALGALRKLWGDTGRERAFFGPQGGTDAPSGRDTMLDITGGLGFGGLDTFANDNEATTNTHKAGQNLNAAWKKTMEREGKLLHPGQSVGDLIGKTKEGGLSPQGEEEA